MKILVFSDNHKDVEIIDKITRMNPDCDRYISLGDSEMSESALSSRNIFGVKGNYPFEPDFPQSLVFEFESHRTFFTHGHHFYVKTGLYNLTEYAIENQIDLVFFGHTHQYVITERDGVVLVNPGSTTFPKGAHNGTFALVTISSPRIKVEIMDVESNLPIETFVKKY
jgi:hypothetical protein